METQQVKFIANKVWLSSESHSAPKPIIKTIPDWYRKADRFAKDPETGEYLVEYDGGKVSTWKACPAIFDIMGSGYSLNTPCDIEIIKGANRLEVKMSNVKYEGFVTLRSEMPQFEHPKGYRKDHFAWNSDWNIKLPDGYSMLYTQPFNRFELPFFTTSGIIDNDKVNHSGSLPFFIAEGFEGVIPARTPYVQLLPFKRENWQSEHIEQNSMAEILKHKHEISNKYRKRDGGVYKNDVWEMRKYE
jgi:hypothetical protein